VSGEDGAGRPPEYCDDSTHNRGAAWRARRAARAAGARPGNPGGRAARRVSCTTAPCAAAATWPAGTRPGRPTRTPPAAAGAHAAAWHDGQEHQDAAHW